ncbi:MAG: hypothetical protein GOV00_03505 [Candidatus Altiarchaeota archaeon]|nr:hypothetical protein [Candidatus Altiarchaeota archaeon]
MAVENLTMNITTGVTQLQEIGFFNYVIPFGIFFALLFGVLDKYKIISKDKKINALIAVLMSAFVLLYAKTTNLEIFFMEFYAKMSIAMLIFLFAMTLSVFGFRALKDNEVIPAGKEGVWSAVFLVSSVMIMNVAFSEAPGQLGIWASEVSGIVLAFGIIGAIASFAIKDKGGGS